MEFEETFYEINSTDDNLSLKLKRKNGSLGMIVAQLELFTKNFNLVCKFDNKIDFKKIKATFVLKILLKFARSSAKFWI